MFTERVGVLNDHMNRLAEVRPEETQRQGEVARYIMQIGQLLNVLDDSVLALEESIRPILSSPLPTPNSAEKMPAPDTDAGRILCDHAMRIDSIISQINSIKKRVEL